MRISCEEAKRLVAAGAQLVDVRTQAEFAMGAAPGAMNIPVQVLPYSAESLDKSKPVIVYCASGGRSAQAGFFLKGMGFDQVHDLGGINNYFQC